MKALVDGDIVCFRCATSMGEETNLGILHFRINEMMDQILSKTEANSFMVFLTGQDNFRRKIYPEYKANRPQEKPQWWKEAREFLVSEFNAYIVDGQEADDALAINQTTHTVICSIDKDLLQVPGKHFNFVKDEWYDIDYYEGLYRFYKQCLMGDRSDNIRGVAGIGDKKADKILKECFTETELFNAVRDTYGNDEEFLMNARCLWIRRKEGDNYKYRFEKLAHEITISEEQREIVTELGEDQDTGQVSTTDS